jgi:hypothetical protein
MVRYKNYTDDNLFKDGKASERERNSKRKKTEGGDIWQIFFSSSAALRCCPNTSVFVVNNKIMFLYLDSLGREKLLPLALRVHRSTDRDL